MGLKNLVNRIFDKDQFLFDNFNEKQKLSFCRLIREMSLVDGQTINAEFAELPSIPKTMIGASSQLTYDEAIQNLKCINANSLKLIIKEMNQMSKGDGYISQQEKDLLQKIEKDLNS